MSSRVTDGVVDSHVHLLPPRLATKVRAAFEAHGGAALAYDDDPHALLADLAAQGVIAAWVLPYAHKPGVSEWLVPATAAHLEVLRAAGTGVELVRGATLHPRGDDPAGVLRTAVEEHGARVLKLHCSVGGFHLDDPVLDTIWTACSTWRLPVVAHAAYPAVGATLRALERYPNLYADLTPVVARVPDPGAEALAHRDVCCSVPTRPTPATGSAPCWHGWSARGSRRQPATRSSAATRAACWPGSVSDDGGRAQPGSWPCSAELVAVLSRARGGAQPSSWPGSRRSCRCTRETG